MNFNDQHQQNIHQVYRSQEMAEYLFFYKAYNDSQIYNINCKEISFETISRLLSTNSNDCLTQNNTQPNNTHVFYFQHPVDKKIYKVTCEIVRYNYILWMLNKINYDIELNLNEQQQQETFSREHKENLEFHLKQYLTNYLAPINTYQQHTHVNTNI
jgi:hypothetical protein